MYPYRAPLLCHVQAPEGLASLPVAELTQDAYDQVSGFPNYHMPAVRAHTQARVGLRPLVTFRPCAFLCSFRRWFGWPGSHHGDATRSLSRASSRPATHPPLSSQYSSKVGATFLLYAFLPFASCVLRRQRLAALCLLLIILAASCLRFGSSARPRCVCRLSAHPAAPCAAARPCVVPSVGALAHRDHPRDHASQGRPPAASSSTLPSPCPLASARTVSCGSSPRAFVVLR